MSKKSQNTS